jgi:hypothetical protein
MDQFEKKHLAVNWVDGMLINSNHFQQLEKSIISRIAQPAGLYTHATKYGLIPDAYNQWTFELDWDASVNTLQVKHCKGVTPGGWIIDIFPELNVKISPDIPRMQKESKPHPEGLWALLLHVQPEEPVEVGIPDPSETSRTGTRLPYTIPTYSLELLPRGSNKAVSGSHTLLIGMFQLEASNLHLLPYKDRQGNSKAGYFIPPCVNLSSNPILEEIHKNLRDKLIAVHEFAIQTVRNINQKEIRDWDSSVAIPMQTLGEEMARYLAIYLGPFRLLLPEQPPVYLVNYFVQFARSFQTTLDLLKPAHEQKLLNFFKEWTGLSPSDLRQSFTEIATLAYSHEDIAKSVSTLEDFLSKIHTLFEQLSQLEPKWEKKREEKEGSVIVEKDIDHNKGSTGGGIRLI